jgi:hypothetical protein
MDPVRAAADAVDGWVVFRGRVTEKQWESRDGYMFGETLGIVVLLVRAPPVNWISCAWQ